MNKQKSQNKFEEEAHQSSMDILISMLKEKKAEQLRKKKLVNNSNFLPLFSKIFPHWFIPPSSKNILFSKFTFTAQNNKIYSNFFFFYSYFYYLKYTTTVFYKKYCSYCSFLFLFSYFILMLRELKRKIAIKNMFFYKQKYIKRMNCYKNLFCFRFIHEN